MYSFINNRYFYIFFILGLLLAGCSSKTQMNEQSLSLVGEEIYIDDDVDCGFILKIISDTIYSLSHGREYIHQYTVISDDSLKPGKSFSRKGSGPGEFIYASLGLLNNVPYIFGNCNGTFKSAKIELNDSLSDNITLFQPMSMQQVSSSPATDFIVEDDSTLLLIATSWADPKNIFCRHNLNTGQFTPINYWPEDNFTGSANSKFRFYADNSKFQSNKSGKYLYSLGNGRKAFIFSIRNDSVVIEHTLYDNPVNYRADESGLNYGYDYTGYEFKTDSNDAIIVFLHRHLTADGSEPKSGEIGAFGNRVSVWDWDGNKIGEYELDHLVYAVFVNSTDNSFYGKSFDKDTGKDLIWRYRIE